MRALQLDYARARRSAAAGMILLALGITVGTWTVSEYLAAREQLALEDARLEQGRNAGKRTSASGSSVARETAAQEIQTAQLVLARLAVRWADLFNALESTRTDGVALLAVEPDASQATVKILAEARNSSEMINYVERLQAAQRLVNVTLVSHQLKASDPLQPLRFTVLASWAK